MLSAVSVFATPPFRLIIDMVFTVQTFDDKKAREELERAQRGGTKAAGVGCIVVVLALVVLLVFTLVSGVSILSAM